MNNSYLCVFDFETDSAKPEQCNPVQLAAIIIDPGNLNVLDNTFSSNIRPPDIEDKNGSSEAYIEEHKSTIGWHCKIQNIDTNKLIENWKNAQDEKLVWQNFNNFLSQYHTRQSRQSKFTAPIACGANIKNFDLIIADRLNKKYKYKYSFAPRDYVDIQQLAFYWFENKSDAPKSYSMDNLRDYFGMSDKSAHDALQDVIDEAAIITRFLQLHRKVGIKFRNALKT